MLGFRVRVRVGGTVEGGYCPGGYCPGGILSGGYCPGGCCPGGCCPGGYCPGGYCPGDIVRGDIVLEPFVCSCVSVHWDYLIYINYFISSPLTTLAYLSLLIY